jgi:glycerol-3-phosphate dehydrogenase
MKDVIVIGAGIIGSTITYELSKYNKKIMIIDKNEAAGLAVTGHNSAIVHNGADPKSNTLKEKYNVLGSKMYEDYCKELKTPFRQVGAFVVARNKEDSLHIDELIENAKARNVFVERLTKEQAKAMEPNLSDDIYEVLNMPTTAIVDPTHLSQRAVEKAIQNGVMVSFNEEVVAIKIIEGGFEVVTNRQSYQTKAIVNAAGLYAPKIEQMISESTFSLVMIRGEYLVLGEDAKNVTSRVLYPVPSKLGKGVLAVPTIKNQVLIGPNAVDVDSPEDDYVTDEGLSEVKEKIHFIVKDVPYEFVVDRFAGIRPKEKNDDFIVEENKHVPFFFNVVGIDSPGIASAPAIAVEFVHETLKSRLALNK